MSTNHCIELLLQHALEQNCAAPPPKKKGEFLTLCLTFASETKYLSYLLVEHKLRLTEKQTEGENADLQISARLFIEVLLQHCLEQNSASQAQKHKSTKAQKHKRLIFNTAH